MNFYVMTLFPEMIDNAMGESITGRAIKAGFINVNAINIRDFAMNKHNSVDDYPYGGGAGMVMQAEPVYLCYQQICKKIQETYVNNLALNKSSDNSDKITCEQCNEEKTHTITCEQYNKENSYAFVNKNKKTYSTRVVYLTPQGRTLNQTMVEEYSKEEDLILLCGHYEGIDERVLEEIVTDYVSIGDYVLTGGELPALVMMDAISRFVPGVLNNGVSARNETFSGNLLEYPQYTRPEHWRGKSVPPVLLSGNHKKLAAWYREQSVLRTAKLRPDLLKGAELTDKEKEMLELNNLL